MRKHFVLTAVLSCSGPAVRNYNYYSAPPLVGGYGGYGYGYGGGGISLFPTVPIFFGGGGLFNIIIFMVRTSPQLQQSCFPPVLDG